ncbi:MAG: FHIPEP family type III secretion protein [Candidatus Eremiobacteraeota bacterium]|nr:FHIPEP family type III secretion protein [Candidatus Eremiobacteraeota bacterium]
MSELKEQKLILTVLSPEKENLLDFEPVETRGRLTYLMVRKDETALFSVGSPPMLDADLHKHIMKLRNEGWEILGELRLDFQGKDAGPGEEILFASDPLTLELGGKLLPLLDPEQGAPLVSRLTMIREEIAKETGIIIPGIRIIDNMNLDEQNYLIRYREIPLATGEIYLGKLLAVGDMEKLGQIKGWSTVEPSYRMQAKWIDPVLQDQAQKIGCMVIGPLNVLLTHVKTVLTVNAPNLLGLQELANILERLGETHPVVVEEFLQDKKKLRALRRILKNLLSEQVSIRDMITILEIVGEHMEKIENTPIVTEFVRMGLGRQICLQSVDNEGRIRALAVSPEMEKFLLDCMEEGPAGVRLALDPEQAENMINKFVEAFKKHDPCWVLITDPQTRIYWKRLLERALPRIRVMSTMEISPGIKIETPGSVDLPENMKLQKKKKKGKK